MTDDDSGMSSDDRELMHALARSIALPSLPPGLVERCEGLLAWADVDSDLAMLLDQPLIEAAGTRGATVDGAALEFAIEDGSWVIEISVSGRVLRGQLLGGDAGVVVVRTSTGDTTASAVDEHGAFEVAGAPLGPIRLEMELDGGVRRIHTDWFVV